MKNLKLSFFIGIVSLFFSCSPRVCIDFKTVDSQVGADVNFSTGISTVALDAIKNLAGLSSEESIFDEALITESLKKSDLQQKKLKIGKDSSIDLTFYSKNLALLGMSSTSQQKAQLPLIKTDYDSLSQIYSVELLLNPATFESLFGIFPADFKDYAELLMAPIFTAESLSPEEYADLIGAAYGTSLQKELLSASCIIEGTTPKAITSFTWCGEEQSQFVGKTKFNLPISLATLLSSPSLNLNLSWKK